jgi:hypothetical protein
MILTRSWQEKQVTQTLRYGAGGLLAAFGLCWALSVQAQSPWDLPAAGAAGGETANAAPGTMVPTNMPGVYAFTQAPPGFAADTATPEELAQYGYPPRPDAAAGAEALAQWQRVTAPTLERVVPALAPTNLYHQPVALLQVDEQTRAADSSNWSGYAVVRDAGSAPFYSVVGHWTVPTVQLRFGPCSGNPVYSAQWVGIDGFSNSDLLQSGSEADAYCDAGVQKALYYPWVEWLPAAEISIRRFIKPRKPLVFHPGDYLMVHVWASHWVNGASQTGHVLFTDLTQNWQFGMAFASSALRGSKVVGRSAEWVVERPLIGAGLAPLANYTADPWALVYAGDLGRLVHTPAAPDTAKSYKITMFDDAGVPISRVRLYGNSALWFYNEGPSR